jgi:hypothetical protein
MKNALRKAIRKNWKMVNSPDGKGLFTPDNYLFSTKAEGREETLYFGNRETKQTGRLRQEHPKGPLATIDKEPRTHLFLSKVRYKRLKLWHEENPYSIPSFSCRELRRVEGKRHIEFACEGKKLRWHRSKGTVKASKNSKVLVNAALKKACGDYKSRR